MKTSIFGLALLILSSFSLACSADIIVDDNFDDGDLTMNLAGIGTGFTVSNSSGGNFTEAGTEASFGGTGGASRSFLISNEDFDANGALSTTTTFVVNEFGRQTTDNSSTGRFFVGLSDATAQNGVIQNTVDGLWVVLQANEDVGPAENTIDNGNGGLFFIDGSTVTALGLWTWNTDLVDVDTASTFRSDRISQDLLPNEDLTIELSSDAVGYSLSFSTNGVGTVPTAISGTYAAAGITNDLTQVSAVVAGQGDQNNFVVDQVVVRVNAVPEPSSFALVAGLGGLVFTRRRRR